MGAEKLPVTILYLANEYSTEIFRKADGHLVHKNCRTWRKTSRSLNIKCIVKGNLQRVEECASL